MAIQINGFTITGATEEELEMGLRVVAKMSGDASRQVVQKPETPPPPSSGEISKNSERRPRIGHARPKGRPRNAITVAQQQAQRRESIERYTVAFLQRLLDAGEHGVSRDELLELAGRKGETGAIGGIAVALNKVIMAADIEPDDAYTADVRGGVKHWFCTSNTGRSLAIVRSHINKLRATESSTSSAFSSIKAALAEHGSENQLSPSESVRQLLAKHPLGLPRGEIVDVLDGTIATTSAKPRQLLRQTVLNMINRNQLACDANDIVTLPGT